MVAGDCMNRTALIRQSDAKRLAQIVREEGVSVEVEVRGVKIIIRPDAEKPVDAKRRPAL
jgi:hypothetical protein